MDAGPISGAPAERPFIPLRDPNRKVVWVVGIDVGLASGVEAPGGAPEMAASLAAEIVSAGDPRVAAVAWGARRVDLVLDQITDAEAWSLAFQASARRPGGSRKAAPSFALASSRSWATVLHPSACVVAQALVALSGRCQCSSSVDCVCLAPPAPAETGSELGALVAPEAWIRLREKFFAPG